jgi:hypothetical protein
MTFVPVVNTVQVELRQTLLNQYVENTLSFYNPFGLEPGDLVTIADLMADFWYYELRTDQRTYVYWREAYARDLSSDEAPAYTSTKWSGEHGAGSSGTILPTHNTLCISLRTAGRGRSCRGRNYTIGMTTTHITNNQVTAAYRDAMLGHYRTLLPGGSRDPTPFIWVVVSRYHNNQPRETGVVYPITSVTVTNDNIDCQRRRLTGRGT